MVVAYDLQRGIGAGGDLPWGRSLPTDLAHFRKITSGGTVIMGRKTFESIGSKPLPDRENIVLSSKPLKSVTTATSLSEALKKAQHNIFIIGGERVFSEALLLADTIYATEVDHHFKQGDVFFPALGKDWQETSRTHHPVDEKNKYPFDFVRYQRV